MNRFWIRLVNWILIVGILIGYNVILSNRKQQEEVLRLQAELTTEQQLNASYEKAEEKEEDTQESKGNYAAYESGVYQGSAEGFGGTITVSLTLEDGVMTELSVLSAKQEDSAYLESARTIIDTILTEQSVEVDTVSGATYSSTGILNAVIDALNQAKKE